MLRIKGETGALKIISHLYWYPEIMFMRILIALCLIAVVESVSLAACQIYCSSVNGGPSYNNCSPWISFATQTNQTCYNLCVHNCAAVYDGSCINNNNFRCCLSLSPTRRPEFRITGCNLLYNNLV